VQEPVDALVTSHGDVGDGIDPQPRRLAPADAAVEKIDLCRDFGEDRIERFVEQFEPGKFRIAQVDLVRSAASTRARCTASRSIDRGSSLPGYVAVLLLFLPHMRG
jgi:hypothetical protein